MTIGPEATTFMGVAEVLWQTHTGQFTSCAKLAALRPSSDMTPVKSL